MTRRALLLVNPASRNGRAVSATTIGAALAPAGITVAAAAVGADGLGAALRREGAACDLVIIGGGDGTLNGAADALLELGRPVGILPLGTANDLARTLGLPTDLPGACAVIADGITRRIDLGRVNGKAFFNVASVGLSVELARALTAETKRRWGRLAYPVSLWRVLKRSRHFHARIACDGETLELRSMQVAVGNGRHYGGGMTVAHDAAIDDATLDLYALRPQGPWRLMRRALALRRGVHDDPASVIARSGRVITLETRPVLPVNTDGELTTRTPARFEVVADALEVLVPAAG
jgi:YegS/Rv2252/BmrU family lipid kinase